MKGLGRNILSLAGGNIIAQVISLLAVPVLTRLYSTSEFGVFSAYMSIVLIIVPVSTLRFNSALLVVETEEQAENLLILSLASVVSFSAALALLVFVLSVNGIGGLLQEYLWLIPLSVLILGFVQSIQFWVLRRKLFNTVAIAQISESVTDRVTSISLGFGGFISATGLIAGRVIGPAFNALLLCLRLNRIAGWPSLRRVNWCSLWQSICRYRDFPLFSSWAFFASSASREAPVFMLAMLYNPTVAGLYGLGLRVLNIPMLMVGDAVSKALLARVREHTHEPKVLGNLLLKMFSLVSYPGMLLMLILVAVGPELFSFIFGEEWHEAGTFAAVLSPAIMLMLNYRITSVLFDLYNKQRIRMLFDGGLLAVRVISLAISGMIGMSVLNALTVMMLVTSLLYATGIAYLFNLVHMPLSAIMLRLWRNTLLVIPSLIGIVLVHYIGLVNLLLLAALLVIGAIQVVTVLYFDRRLFTRSVIRHDKY